MTFLASSQANGAAIQTQSFEKPLTIAVNETSFPYHSVNKHGEPVGLMIDLWTLWAKKQQVDIEFVSLKWKETLEQVSRGEVDIHAGLSIIDKRRELFSYSKPIFPLYTHVYIHQQLREVDNLSDLKPYAVGVVSGSAHINMLAKHYPQLQQKAYSSRHALYQAALDNELFVFTGLEKLAKDYQHYKTLNKQFPAHKRLRYQQGDYGVAVAKGNATLLAFIEEGLKKISPEERANIERKWLGIEKQKNSLLVAIAPNYPPFMAVTPAGKAQGLLVDVWRYWSKHTGTEVEFVVREMQEDLSLVKEGKVDVLLAYPNNNQNISGALLAKAIYRSTAQVFVAKHLADLTSLALFTGKQSEHVIGVWQGSPLITQLLTQYPNLNVRYFPSVNDMLRAAEKNEISAMFSLVEPMNAKLIGANLQSSFYKLEPVALSVNLSPLVNHNNVKLQEMIDSGFDELDIKQLVDIEKRWLLSGNHYYQKIANKVSLTVAEKQFLHDKPDIKVGLIKELSPVEFINEQGHFDGINRDILNLVSERTGLAFSYYAFDSWQQLFQGLMDNDVDMIGSVTPTKERQKTLLFSDSYWRMPWVIVHPQHVGKKSTLKDFEGKQVAIVKGYYLITQLRKQYPLITFKLVDDREQGLLALQQERVDGFITTIASATELLKRENLITLMISVMENVSLDDSRFAINNTLPLLKSIVNKGLLTVSEKEKQSIYDRWFSVAINTGLDKNVVLQVGAQIGVIILLVLIVILIRNRRLQSEIDHREQLEKIMKHMATHDELTGLANRVLLKDRLSTAIDFHQRQSLKMAVLFIDLDGFKNINDTYGHDVGDELLKLVAIRLQGCVRKSDTVVRFGGDEFVLLLTGLHSHNEGAYVAEKVLKLMQTPFDLSQTNASIGCSIGIAMYPRDGDTDTDLLKIADTLMYQVKAAGKNHYSFSVDVQGD